MAKNLIINKYNTAGVLTKPQANKLAFKLCKNFAGILESL